MSCARKSFLAVSWICRQICQTAYQESGSHHSRWSRLQPATQCHKARNSSTQFNTQRSQRFYTSAIQCCKASAPPPAPALPGRWRNLDVVQFLLANGATAGEMPLVVKNGVHNEVAQNKIEQNRTKQNKIEQNDYSVLQYNSTIVQYYSIVLQYTIIIGVRV